MRKVDNREKTEGGRESNYILVATNAVASRPPECLLTGTPIARAKSKQTGAECQKKIGLEFLYNKILFPPAL